MVKIFFCLCFSKFKDQKKKKITVVIYRETNTVRNIFSTVREDLINRNVKCTINVHGFWAGVFFRLYRLNLCTTN